MVTKAPDTGAKSLLPLHFSVDIECYIATLTSQDPDPHSTAADRARHHLRKVHGLNCEKRSEYSAYKRYRSWEITQDDSLTINYTDEGMQEHYRKGCDLFGKTSKVSLGGVEVVSPPMPALSVTEAPRSQRVWQDEVSPYFKALTSQVQLAKRADRFYKEPDFLPYTTEACGFHVHIGLRDNQVLPLPVLKQLAILCLIYEPVINTLHQPHRTPNAKDNADVYCESNRTAFRPDGHSCKDYLLTADDFSLRINHCDTLQELVYVMGTCEPVGTNRHVPTETNHKDLRFAKHRIVNWSNLTDLQSSRTIEFRQPAGTLDATHAAFTVQLYIALVRAAERRANLVAAGLPREAQEEVGTHHGLFTVLDLCVESEKYWREQVVECTQRFARETRKRWPPSYRDECGRCREVGMETLPATVARPESLLLRGARRLMEGKKQARTQIVTVDGRGGGLMR